MPSSATITSSTFYVFEPGERPRIGKMNANFSIWRGHVIPVDPNTITASNNSYDLGSEEYRWRTLYTRKLDLSVTSTSSLTVEANTAGEFVFKKAGSAICTLGETGFSGGYNKTPFRGATTTAAVGDLAQSGILNLEITTTGQIAGSTCTLQTLGRPVLVCLQPDNSTATTSSFVRSYTFGGALAGRFEGNITFYRNGSIATVITMRTDRNNNNIILPPGYFSFIDFPSSGSNIYSIAVGAMAINSPAGTAGSCHLILNNIKVTAYEL